MKLLLVCPNSDSYMPYLKYYTEILAKLEIQYDTIYWDRLHDLRKSDFVYSDKKKIHKRGFIDYYKYSKFVLSILKKDSYEFIIIFSIQMYFFLQKTLTREYFNKYILDVRDYHILIHFINKKILSTSLTQLIVSSPAYKRWLPADVKNKVLVSHNASFDSSQKIELCDDSSKINISYIGALRDYKINKLFLLSLKKSNKINILYHGYGLVNDEIKKVINKYDIPNATLTGRYDKSQEYKLYRDSTIINVLRFNDGINNRTALPNRLYNTVYYGKPLLAFKGTYLSELIIEYDLGIVIDNFDNLENKIITYMSNLNRSNFDQNRNRFLSVINKENKVFVEKITNILSDYKVGQKNEY